MNRQPQSRSITSKKLTVGDYRRRLKDNVRSMIENLGHIFVAAKINTEDSAAKTGDVALMGEYLTLCNEISSRTALIARAAIELLKLTNDIREFLILRDFNFISTSIERAELETKAELKLIEGNHIMARALISMAAIELDRELADSFGLRH